MTQQIGGGLAIGAGVGISSVALAPFNAANTFLGSAFFGYGMILGERYMYQADWPKIQQRLENGEQIENIIQEYTGRFTATVMKEAKIIFDTVTQEFISIMAEALRSATAGNEQLTAEQERRRSRGGGSSQPPPQTETIPTPTNPIVNPTISAFQPNPFNDPSKFKLKVRNIWISYTHQEAQTSTVAFLINMKSKLFFNSSIAFENRARFQYVSTLAKSKSITSTAIYHNVDITYKELN